MIKNWQKQEVKYIAGFRSVQFPYRNSFRHPMPDALHPSPSSTVTSPKGWHVEKNASAKALVNRKKNYTFPFQNLSKSPVSVGLTWCWDARGGRCLMVTEHLSAASFQHGVMPRRWQHLPLRAPTLPIWNTVYPSYFCTGSYFYLHYFIRVFFHLKDDMHMLLSWASKAGDGTSRDVSPSLRFYGNASSKFWDLTQVGYIFAILPAWT